MIGGPQGRKRRNPPRSRSHETKLQESDTTGVNREENPSLSYQSLRIGSGNLVDSSPPLTSVGFVAFPYLIECQENYHDNHENYASR